MIAVYHRVTIALHAHDWSVESLNYPADYRKVAWIDTTDPQLAVEIMHAADPAEAAAAAGVWFVWCGDDGSKAAVWYTAPADYRPTEAGDVLRLHRLDTCGCSEILHLVVRDDEPDPDGGVEHDIEGEWEIKKRALAGGAQ